MRARIAIDGACRRNGKPDCVSSGGVFIQTGNTTLCLGDTEIQSTNQRGELQALLVALRWLDTYEVYDAQIITDSEYLFNAMTREWYKSWERNDWRTAAGEPLKNADMWQQISVLASNTVNYYHIKGHCIPFGRVTAEMLLSKDPTGTQLMQAVYDKYDALSGGKLVDIAQELSLKNNGFNLTEEVLRDFVVANVVADAIATSWVDAADALRK